MLRMINVGPCETLSVLTLSRPVPSRLTVLPGGVLQIHAVRAEDAGNYRCIATNIANRRRSVEATLTVTPGRSEVTGSWLSRKLTALEASDRPLV